MTCLIATFTSTKIVLSADSAATLENRVSTGFDKLFELSNDPPLVIMIYNSSDFNNIPLENIISEFKKTCNFKTMNTVLKVKKEFLKFIHNNFNHETMEDYIELKLSKFKDEIKDIDDETLKEYCKTKLNFSVNDTFKNYQLDFSDVKPEKITFNEQNIFNHNMCLLFKKNLENETNGIIIIGIDKKTMKNSYCEFEMIFNGIDEVVVENENDEINFIEGKIRFFAQDDVIKTYINGFNDELILRISENITDYSNELLDIFMNNIERKNILDMEVLNEFYNEIREIKENSIIQSLFEDEIENMKQEIEKNMNEELNGMSKKELIEMNQSLINLTKFKRILNSEMTTVGGDVKTIVLSLKEGIEKF